MTRARASWGWIAAGAMTLAAPAYADVKAGVDAWNRGDYSRAVAEWRGPALAGDADAEYNMGQAYKLGRGVPADLAQAELWYQKAAAQGHTLAQDNFGLALFQEGRKADALPWLEKSVARDEKRTELVLGTMLFNGDAVAKDWVRAYALVSRSSQQGLPQASQTLAQLDGYLSPEQRQQGVALAGRIADQGRSAQLAALANPSTRAAAGSTSARPSKATPVPEPITRAEVPPAKTPSRGQAMVDASTDNGPAVARGSIRPLPAMPPRTHAPAGKPPAVAHGAPAAATGGRWRVQLGAFRDEEKARTLWTRVAARVGGQPSYSKAGAFTRLQAGPFATKAEAERACRAAGSACVVLP